MNSETTATVKMYELLAWLEINRKRLIAGASVVAVVCLGVSYYWYATKQREINASHALDKLGLPLGQEENVTKIPAADYLKVASEYRQTRAGERAVLLAAGTLFHDNKYADALEQFRKFQTAYSRSPMLPIALLGIASCLDAQDKADEALKSYQDVVSRYSAEPVANQARMAMARIYESKKQPESALKLYDEINRADAMSSWRTEANERRSALLKLYPQLTPTNVVQTSTNKMRQKVTITPVPNGAPPANPPATGTK